MFSRRLVALTLNRLQAASQLSRGLKTSPGIMAPIKVGDKLPAVDLFEGNPGNKVNPQEAFGKGKYVIFAIPGAFTPTCTKEHFPSFVKDIDAIKAKGVKEVVCVSVNDPFVMEAFQKSLNADGKVRCLADTCGAFTKAIDLELDAAGLLGNTRSQRYALVVEDGKVTAVNVEPDSSKATCTTSAGLMAAL